MWNCTHFRHSTDEQLRQVRIFFSTCYNLQSVHFELIRAFFPNHFSMSTRKVLHISLTLTFPIFETSFSKLSVVRSCSLGCLVSFDSNLPPWHEALWDRETRELPLLYFISQLTASMLCGMIFCRGAVVEPISERHDHP